jgi:hypothetical protein
MPYSQPDSHFCPYCRGQISAAARYCGACGKPITPSGSDKTIVAGRPPPDALSAYPSPSTYPKKRRQSWLPVLGIALALICCAGALAAASAWFGLAGEWPARLPGLSNPPPAQLRLEPLLSESLQPSAQPQTVTWNNQVTVTLPGGLLPAPQTLTISAVPAAPPPLAANIYHPGAIFDVSLGELTRFAQPLTIELAYDPARLSPAMPAADQLAVAYWQPQAQEWSFIPVQVDETRQVAIIQTQHLTAFGWYYINIKDYAVKNVSPQFRVIYNPNLDTAINVPGKGLKTGIEDFALYTWLALDQAYRRYQAAGFRLPDYRVDVIIGDWSSSSASPSAGVIYVVYNADYPEMAFDGAHELFHLAQYQYLDANEMSGTRWWMEATADYAAGRIAWAGQPDIEKQMGEGIKVNYLDKSIEYLSENTGNSYYRHQYHTAHFLEFLLAGKSGGQNQAKAFGDMWGYVTGKINEHDDPFLLVEEEDIAGDWDVTWHLKQWLGDRSRLDAAYREFAGYFFFNTGSPLPADAAVPDRVPAEAAGQWSYLKVNEKDITSQLFDLPGRYSAKLWGVVVEVDPAKPSRTVSVSGAGNWPRDVAAYVFVLPNDRRVNLGYGQGPPPQATITGGQPVQVNISPGDGLYVLLINSGDQDRQASLKITAEDKKPTITPPTEVQGKWILTDKIVQPPDISGWASCPGVQSEFTASSASFTWPYRSCACPVVTYTHAWPELPGQLEPGQSIPIKMSAHWTVNLAGCGENEYVGARAIINFTERWQGSLVSGKLINNTGQTHQPPAAPMVETATLIVPPHPEASSLKAPSPNDILEVVFTINVDFSNQFEGQVKYIYTFKAGNQ